MTVVEAEVAISILLVAGDPEASRPLRQMPARPALDIAQATSLDSARRAIAGKQFELILLDLSLSDSNGLDSLRELRQALPVVPIVVVCSQSDEDLANRALENGAQDYVVRGIDDDRPLRRALGYAMQRKVAEEEVRSELAKAKRHEARTAVLLHSAREVLHANDLREAAAALLPTCRETVGAGVGAVVLLTGDGQVGEPAFLDITDGGEGTDVFGSTAARRLCQRVISSADWAYENDLLAGDGPVAGAAPGSQPLINVLYVPMIIHRRVYGLLALGNKPAGFDGDDARLAFGFAEVIAVALYNQKNRAALELSESKYRALFDNANDAVFLHDLSEGDRSGRFIEVNDVATRTFGYTKEEFENMSIKTLEAFVRPADAPDIAGLLREKRHLTYEVVGKCKDGRLIPVEVSSHMFTLRGKTVVLSITHDISARKQAEEALRASEEHYRALFEAAPIGIYRTTPDGRILSANPASIKMLGYESLEELATRNLETDPVYGPEMSRAQFKEMIERDGEVRGLEAVWLKRDGSRIIVRESARPILAGDGAVLAYEGTVEDITDQRHAQEALEDIARRERLILRSLPMAQYTIQARDGLGAVWMSDQVKNTTGFKPSKFTTSHAFWADRLHAEDRDRVLAQVGNLGKTEDYLQTEYRWRCADGSYRWFFDQAVLTRDAEGKPREIMGNWLDITERKRTEENLRETVERLGRTLEGTIRAMALAVETRDPYTAGHQRRVAELAEAIAKQMTLGEDQVTLVKLAATIHDIGKIGVPAEILSRPGRIGALEFRLIRSHSQVGYDILHTIEFPWPIADVVLQHHERLDGSGYPLGLTGPEIMLEARILAVADVVEAMASHRPYRPALGVGEALAEVSRQSGTLYDPAVVTACVQVFRETEFLWL